MKKTIKSEKYELEYELEYKKVKNVNLRVKKDGSVHVSAPKHVPLSFIKAFIISKIEFIEKARSSVKALSNMPENEHFFYLGKPYNIKIKECIQNEILLLDNTLQISVKDISLVANILDNWQKEEAQRIITAICEKVYPLLNNYCEHFPELRFKKMTSRWGSCAPEKGVLTFNTHLVHVPIPLIEAVVIHEFAHFVYQDHSKNFHDCVKSIIPDEKVRQRALKSYEALLK